jgi:hypothetical protein
MKWPREASTPLQHAELDNAVKLGDWESVERLTTELLNTNPAPPRHPNLKILAKRRQINRHSDGQDAVAVNINFCLVSLSGHFIVFRVVSRTC